MKPLRILVALVVVFCVMITAVSCVEKPCQHVDANLDHKCDLCTEAVGVCADTDFNHNCDYGCNKTFGTHQTEANSHNCAYCGEKMSDCSPSADDGDCTTAIVCGVCQAELTEGNSQHVAMENSHVCQHCETVVSQCEDTNNDHVCEICGQLASQCEDGNNDHNCDVCGEVLSTCQDCFDDGKITTPATCTTRGEKTYTCTVCGSTKTEVVLATGHKDSDGNGKCDVCDIAICQEHQPADPVVENEIPATCTETGSCDVVVYCLACQEELERTFTTLDKKPHNEVVDNAVLPTCTETGLTEGKHCSTCDEILVEQTVVDAIGHNIQDGTCQNCGGYQLTLDFATAEGIESFDGIYAVAEGTTVTIKANFDATCIFEAFEQDGTPVSNQSTYTFTMPDHETSFEAVYKYVANLSLNSTLVKNAVSVETTLSTYTNGGAGVTFSKFFVTKGGATDGTYIYTILNAQGGTTAGSGFDVGVIAKFDTNGNYMGVCTDYAFQWGNAPRLSFVDGILFVTSTNANAYTKYGNTKTYSNKSLAFDTDLNLLSDDYTFAYPDAPQGKMVTHQAQATDGTLAVIYDTGHNHGLYTLSIYNKVDGQYQLFSTTDNPAIRRNSNESRWISSVMLADNHVYLLYTNTNQFRVKLLDLSGNIILDRGLASTEEIDGANSNYQSILQIGGNTYYTIANWSAYSGFGLYKLNCNFTYERAENYSVLTLKSAKVEGLVGNDGTYVIKRGTQITVKVDALDNGYIYFGLEKDRLNNNIVSKSPTYTFTMPGKDISLSAVYDVANGLELNATTVKQKVAVNIYKTTYAESGSGKSFSSFFLTKGTATDGTYIYAILNNNTGTNTGNDIGIIAKFDKNGNYLGVCTDFAFQWGNAPRLSFVDGTLYVTGTNATANSSKYGNTKAYSNVTLAFDTNLDLVSDNYHFDLPNAPAGKIVTHLAQRTDGTLCVVFDTGMSKGNYEIFVYSKDAQGNYQFVAKNNSSSLSRTNNGNRWISSVCCSENYIYISYTATNDFRMKMLDYSANVILEAGIGSAPSVGSNMNYQSLIELDGQLHYVLANWDGSYKGLGLYKVDLDFTYQRIRENTVSFDTNGSDCTIDKQYVMTGDLIELPEVPTFTYTNPLGTTYKFVFDGWYANGEEWDFDANAVTGDITLKVRWTLEDSFFAIDQNALERADETTLRAMSFNVLCDDYNNQPAVSPRVPYAVNTILRYMPDVIGLQECDDEWYRLLSSNTSINSIYKFVNYASTTQNKVTYNSTQYTNYSTIMYNTNVLELVEWTQGLLDPPCGNFNCRVLTIAVFKIKENGKTFIFTSTHWALSVGERMQQVANMKPVIDSWKAKYPNTPWMMSGDYNAYDSEISIITLMQQNDLVDSKQAKVTGTVCRTGHISNGMLTVSRDPAIASHWILGRESVTSTQLTTLECIDHIFISQGVESLYYDTIHDEEALMVSDHMPIYCDLKF